MAPIRRYLRITKYSVLEVRIYLDNPGLAQTWLLHPRHNVLPRVIEAVRPLVLPKLREEKERARKKSTRKKNIKDVVVEDDFEVSIFLTETTTRHSLVTKHKHFHDKSQTKLTSTSSRGLVGASNEAPIDVDIEAVTAPIILQEEDDDDEPGGIGAALAAIPPAPTSMDTDAPAARRPKRARRDTGQGSDEEEGLFISSDDDGDVDAVESQSDGAERPPPQKRRKEATIAIDDGTGEDDKKKLAMDITYDGFSIYGRVLCLVVKRRDAPQAAGSSRVGSGSGGSNSSNNNNKTGRGQGQGQAMLENFIISTQMPAGEEEGPV
ncbi:hypothetical protein PFICI_06205 [Pestalotiopsis fici W106-1]|uniref:Uncharacterized protein n=1 Tax=Pestalotiopsis fici (strain W106-1 / CGMCC3.15140) TaxID=1229662 RepID=W3X505_PESFW|nr:uncharacterized protein PFICI_06205 [Pestalotiopsis fici W106-1]ETS81203.1 hypothetical protein PFICI_06205 [Pestalotiopsis fici W106-1]